MHGFDTRTASIGLDGFEEIRMRGHQHPWFFIGFVPTDSHIHDEAVGLGNGTSPQEAPVARCVNDTIEIHNYRGKKEHSYRGQNCTFMALLHL